MDHLLQSVVGVRSRRVTLAEHGDPAGRPVFLLHGTPACRLGNEFAHAPAVERGIRVICPDRPGIGGSDPLPGRTLRGYAGELGDLADALGIREFAVVGYSCGGPYALACAAGCGPRLTGVALMAGAGPIGDRPAALDGLAPSDRQLLELVHHRPARAAWTLRAMKLAARYVPAMTVEQFADELAPPDRAALDGADPAAVMAFFVESMRQGPAGVIEEYRLWSSPWDIDWSAITVPVHVFQGEADQMVPMDHAEDIVARLPEGIGRLHRLPGVGHISIHARIGEILDAASPAG
ncbi:alpha/beta fold hydrolase [Pseudonocardia sp.]|uniref:alpha/beta fold hydrolase n=1 Tax=Pseudonocardia sp. TaxID=60912 RepID=UPI003D119B7B